MSMSSNTAGHRIIPTALLASGLLSLGAVHADEVITEGLGSEELTLRIVQLADNLQHPWGIAELPDGRFLVTERPGRLALIDGGEVTHLEDLPEVLAQGQGGLLDVLLHPAYDNGEMWIYLTYSKPGDGGSVTALARAQLDGERLTDFEELFEQERYSDPGRHYGSRLAWLPDGTLLMTIGDRGVTPERAQDPGDHAGTVLRLTETGDVPDDNPFVDDSETLDEIYSLGNRNIQGFTVSSDGTIWASEHGPLGGDELNLIESGENYGWPTVSRGVDYGTWAPIGEDTHPDVQDARYIYTDRFAPSGLAQVDSQHFSAWQGNLLAGGLGSEQLKRLVISDGEISHRERVLDGEIGRIREVLQGSDGYIYLLTDEADGGLFRLEPDND